MNIQAGIDKLDELIKPIKHEPYDVWLKRCLRDFLTLLSDSDDLNNKLPSLSYLQERFSNIENQLSIDIASKTINGSSLGWMLDQIRKQEKRLMAVEKAYELERLEDIERRIGELDSKVARIIYETNCYEAIYGKPSVPDRHLTDVKCSNLTHPFYCWCFCSKKDVKDEKPEQTLEDVNILTREYVDVDGFGVIEVRYKKQDHSKVSIDRKVADEWFTKFAHYKYKEDVALINELKLALQR